MSIKTIALAVATVAATATAASANSYFSFGDRLDNSSTLDLGVVRSADAGVVEIYDGRFGDLGRLLDVRELLACLQLATTCDELHGDIRGGS